MATNLALDDDLIEEARRAGNHKTKKDAVTAALAETFAGINSNVFSKRSVSSISILRTTTRRNDAVGVRDSAGRHSGVVARIATKVSWLERAGENHDPGIG